MAGNNENTNRKKLGKCLEGQGGRSSPFDNLDSLSEEQLAKLRRNSFWLNPEKCSDQFLEEAKAELLAKCSSQGPRILLDSVPPIDPSLLLKQLEEQMEKGASREPLLHNCGKQLRELYRWPPLRASIKPLFSPVHYSLYFHPSEEIEKTNSRTSMAQLQDKLVASQKGKSSRCAELLAALEIQLAATLIQVWQKGPTLISLMEWSESLDYALLVILAVSINHLVEDGKWKTHVRSALLEGVDQEEATKQLGEAETKYVYYAIARQEHV
jgi:hypothetical protein